MPSDWLLYIKTHPSVAIDTSLPTLFCPSLDLRTIPGLYELKPRLLLAVKFCGTDTVVRICVFLRILKLPLIPTCTHDNLCFTSTTIHLTIYLPWPLSIDPYLSIEIAFEFLPNTLIHVHVLPNQFMAFATFASNSCDTARTTLVSYMNPNIQFVSIKPSWARVAQWNGA